MQKMESTHPIFSICNIKTLLLHDQSDDQDTCMALQCNDEFQGLLAILFSIYDLALLGQSWQESKTEPK